jgi:hypothetical protein
MRYEVVEVTPAMATAWQAKNAACQRKLRQTIVDRYARDMLNGAWKLTHQGIAFDNKGMLIDGQHRLAAIQKAGVPVKMVVVRDAPTTAFDHVDIGFCRTTADVLKAQGEGWITNDHIAIARFMEAGSNVKATTVARSPFEAREMVETHKNAISFVQQNCERHVRGVTIAPVLAAVAVAYYTELDRVGIVHSPAVHRHRGGCNQGQHGHSPAGLAEGCQWQCKRWRTGGGLPEDAARAEGLHGRREAVEAVHAERALLFTEAPGHRQRLTWELSWRQRPPNSNRSATALDAVGSQLERRVRPVARNRGKT